MQRQLMNCMLHASAFLTRRILRVILGCVLLCVVSPNDCRVMAEKPASVSRNGAAKELEIARECLEKMLRIAGEFRFEMPDDQPPAEIHPQALLRWNNPVSTVRDGILGVYLTEGRPVGFVEIQLHASGTIIHEFSSVLDKDVELQRDSKSFWTPADTWSKYLRIESMPPPAPKKTQRLLQMKMLARKFAILDQFGFQDDDITPYTLRLMPNPIYRIEENEALIDGACFVFAQGTNPEAVLLVEAVREDERSVYRCLIVPSTIYALRATFDGDVVWQKPRHKVFNEKKGPYLAGRYMPD